MEAAVATVTAARAGAAATDGELVGAVRRGDDAAFAELYVRYQRPIAAFVASMVRDHARAEDVTQDVFLSALRRMRATDAPISVRPWLYEIARNASIDQFRRSSRAQEVSYDGDAGAGGLVAGDATPDVVVERKQQLDFLRGALGGLTETQHQVLVLRELEGRTYREIGERLEMTEGAVESTLFRARKRLGEEFQDLVTGERCIRVQGLITIAGESELGARDRRRASRHLAHCRSCRVQAHAAGLDALVPAARRAIPLGLGGLLPLPALLRRRLGGGGSPADDGGQVMTLAGWISGTGGSLEPMAGLGKAAVTAAAVAAVGLGAGTPPGGDTRREQVRGVVSAPPRAAVVPPPADPGSTEPAAGKPQPQPGRRGPDPDTRGVAGPGRAPARDPVAPAAPSARGDGDDGGGASAGPGPPPAAAQGVAPAPPPAATTPAPAAPADPVAGPPAASPDPVASARQELDGELDGARRALERGPGPPPASVPAPEPAPAAASRPPDPVVPELEQRLDSAADEVERRTADSMRGLRDRIAAPGG